MKQLALVQQLWLAPVNGSCRQQHNSLKTSWLVDEVRVIAVP